MMSYVVMRIPNDPVEGELPHFLIDEVKGAYSWCRKHERATNHEDKNDAMRECAKAVLAYAGCGFDIRVVEV